MKRTAVLTGFTLRRHWSTLQRRLLVSVVCLLQMGMLQDQMTFLEAVEDTSSASGADEKSEDFYGGGGQFRKGGKEHFPQLWCGNGTYSSYGQVRHTNC